MENSKDTYDVEHWGYEEDENGPQRLLPLEVLTEKDWEKHVKSVFR